LRRSVEFNRRVSERDEGQLDRGNTRVPHGAQKTKPRQSTASHNGCRCSDRRVAAFVSMPLSTCPPHASNWGILCTGFEQMFDANPLDGCCKHNAVLHRVVPFASELSLTICILSLYFPSEGEAYARNDTDYYFDTAAGWRAADVGLFK
jgi:hypothetical protein